MMHISIEKCINISIMQVHFVNILKISAAKTVKISAKIKVNNIEMKNVLNCQITSTKSIFKNI